MSEQDIFITDNTVLNFEVGAEVLDAKTIALNTKHAKGVFANAAALAAGVPSPVTGDYAILIDGGNGLPVWAIYDGTSFIINGYLQFEETPGQVFVSPSGNDSNVGSIYSPYLTIQHALDQGASLIKLLHGAYVEDITIPVGYGNFGPVIWSYNVHDSQKTEIQGTVTIPAGVSRLRCYGIQFDGQGTKTCLVDNGSEGRHYYENCTFNNSGAADCVQLNNGKRWHEFVRSVIDGKLNLSGTGVSCSLNVKHSTSSYSFQPTVNSGYTLGLIYIERMGDIIHHGGNVLASYVTSWSPNGSGYIIDSDSVNPLDYIFAAYSNYSSDGVTYGTINSSGATVKEAYNITS